MKPLRYSLHAETVMRERKLDPAWVEATVRAPEWYTEDPAGGEVERRYRSIEPLDGRVLRVAYVEADASSASKCWMPERIFRKPCFPTPPEAHHANPHTVFPRPPRSPQVRGSAACPPRRERVGAGVRLRPAGAGGRTDGWSGRARYRPAWRPACRVTG